MFIKLNDMMIRLADIIISVLCLIILIPFFLFIAIFIKIDSRGSAFYKQIRVGKGGKKFIMWKFRTMYCGSDKKGLLTVGMRDSRITRAGLWLRKHKIDELPQLFNVLINDMSLVGPRPELQEYVNQFSDEHKKVLSVKPGMTDYASIKYVNENELLKNSDNPEKTYIEEIIPTKIELNMRYINNPDLGQYLKIIFLTFERLLLIIIALLIP